MASMLQKRIALRRKIHILRAHTISKSVMLSLLFLSFLAFLSQTFHAHTDHFVSLWHFCLHLQAQTQTGGIQKRVLQPHGYQKRIPKANDANEDAY